MSAPGLSVVVPAYREERRLPPSLAKIAALARAHPELALEVVVVDDGSPDATAAAAERSAAELSLPLRVIRFPKNRGKGAAVRAGALAAGFFAAPLVSTLESTLGLSELEIEPGGEYGVITGPKITVGEQLAPGLVARFSRQFGTNEYNQAVIEYYLSRLLRIRATFSDAASVNLRSPFVRVERAGIDLLLFFSF